MLGDLDEVIAELGFDHVADRTRRLGEGGIFEFGNHLALAERAEVAAGAGAGTIGIGLGEFGEIGAGKQLLAEVFDARALGGFGGIVVGRIHLDQDMGSGDGFALGKAFLVFIVEFLDFLVRGFREGIRLGHDHLADGHLLAHFGFRGAGFGHIGFEGRARGQFGDQLGLDFGKLGIGQADALLGHFGEHDLAHDQFFHDAFADPGQGGFHLVGRNARAHLLLEKDENLLDFAFGDLLAVHFRHHDGGGGIGERGFHDVHGGSRDGLVAGRKGDFRRGGGFGGRGDHRSGVALGRGGGFLFLASGQGPAEGQGGHHPNSCHFHGNYPFGLRRA